MNEYIIFTDSACDIAPELLKEWGVKYQNLTFHFEGEEREYQNEEMAPAEFYARMRAGQVAKTSAINVETFKAAFEAELKAGSDVLYLGFSSGLSNTCNAAQLAANELLESYPERKLIVVDTLCASAGQGLLVYLTLQKKNEGASIEEAAAYAREQIPHLCHWFTVDDLMFLKRGGRVSPAVALIGTMLNIKPVMHVDDEGHLIKVSQARGRKASLKAIVEQYDALALTPDAGTVFICHGDCMDDAQRLAGMVREKHGVEVKLITYTGTVIGAHSGPGTLALFFLGTER